MTLDEEILIDISLNTISYNSTSDLYNKNQKKKNKKWINKWCICFTATIIFGLTISALFIFDAFKENVK
jgi:hypothetical protein